MGAYRCVGAFRYMECLNVQWASKHMGSIQAHPKSDKPLCCLKSRNILFKAKFLHLKSSRFLSYSKVMARVSKLILLFIKYYFQNIKEILKKVK